MNLQNYYDTVMQLSHGIVVTLDLNGRVVHGNSELEEVTGYALQELAGVDWFETFIPKDERDLARQAILGRTHDQGVSAVAGAITDRDGDKVYINWNLKPLADSSGEVISILCVGRDVTDQTLREDGLLKERTTLLERNKELSCLYEISQVMSDMSKGMSEMIAKIVNLLPSAFQYPAQTHIRLDVDMQRWETPGFKMNKQFLTQSIVINNDRRGTLVVTTTGRRRRRPFIKNEEDLFVTAAQQIAILVAKKEARQDKLALEAQLRQSDRLAKIGQFSAGVAHEINEPLTNILGFAELVLQTDNLPEQVISDLNSIVASSLHAREIIRKLMFFSRQLPPKLLPVNLNEVVEQALGITASGAKHRNVEIVWELDPALPKIIADPQHLKQVVVNLVANSIQAMEGGGMLTISTEYGESDVYIIVEDTGPGMEPDVLKQIFTPFYTTKEVDRGTGLGLSVVHGIVKAHGGFIQVESKTGIGTRVEVALPQPNSCKEKAR